MILHFMPAGFKEQACLFKRFDHLIRFPSLILTPPYSRSHRWISIRHVFLVCNGLCFFDQVVALGKIALEGTGNDRFLDGQVDQ